MQTAEPTAKAGEPTWAIAHLFPVQGEWSEEEYLALDTNHLVEFSAGYVEVLPMPGFVHQRLAFLLQRLLWEFVTQRGLGEVLAAPLPVQLWAQKYREPDLIFIGAENRDRQPADYVVDPALVMQIVSPHNPERDYEKKRQEYARAGIPEYWIVDPQRRVITILVLRGRAYKVGGEFTPGMRATSTLLAGFSVDVEEVFAAG